MYIYTYNFAENLDGINEHAHVVHGLKWLSLNLILLIGESSS